MAIINLGLCFLSLLAIAFTIRFNDDFAIQRVTRISYRIMKIACVLCVGTYMITAFTTGLTWAAAPIGVVAIARVWLQVHDAKHGEAQRAFADEHPRRPALGVTTMRLIYVIAMALIAYAVSQLQNLT